MCTLYSNEKVRIWGGLLVWPPLQGYRCLQCGLVELSGGTLLPSTVCPQKQQVLISANFVRQVADCGSIPDVITFN